MKSKSQFLLKIIPLFTLFYGTCYSSSLVQFKEGNVAQVANPGYYSGSVPPIRIYGASSNSSPDAMALRLSSQTVTEATIYRVSGRVSAVLDPYGRSVYHANNSRTYKFPRNNMAIVYSTTVGEDLGEIEFAIVENPFTNYDNRFNFIKHTVISNEKGLPYSQSIALIDGGKNKGKFAATFTSIENDLPVGYTCIIDEFGSRSEIKKTKKDVSGLELATIPDSEYVAALYIANKKLNFAVIDPSNGKVIKSESYSSSAKGISLTLKGANKDGSIVYYSSNKGRSGSAFATNKLDLKKITLSKNHEITFEKIKDGYIPGSENDNPQILYLQNGYILETHTVDKKGTLGYLLMDTKGKVLVRE